ncbi:MAG: hypothetical protein WBA63_14305 [Thermomicrobiales bacterium]
MSQRFREIIRQILSISLWPVGPYRSTSLFADRRHKARAPITHIHWHRRR